MDLQLNDADSYPNITELLNKLEDLDIFFAEKFLSYEIALKLQKYN